MVFLLFFVVDLLGANICYAGTPKTDLPWGGKPLTEIENVSGLVSSLCFSPKEEMLVYSTQEAKVYFLELKNNNPLASIIDTSKFCGISRVDLSSCGKYLLTVGKGDGTSHLILWDFLTKKKVWESKDFNRVSNARFFPGQGKIAATDFNELKLFNIDSNNPIASFLIDPGYSSILDFSKDGKQIYVAGSFFGKFHIFSMEGNEGRRTIHCKNYGISALVILKDQIILGGCNKPLLEVKSTGKSSEFFRQTKDWVRCLAASPNNRWLAVSEKGGLSIWDMDKKEESFQIKDDLASFLAAFSSNGEYFAISQYYPRKGTSKISIWKKLGS